MFEHRAHTALQQSLCCSCCSRRGLVIAVGRPAHELPTRAWQSACVCAALVLAGRVLHSRVSPLLVPAVITAGVPRRLSPAMTTARVRAAFEGGGGPPLCAALAGAEPGELAAAALACALLPLPPARVAAALRGLPEAMAGLRPAAAAALGAFAAGVMDGLRFARCVRARRLCVCVCVCVCQGVSCDAVTRCPRVCTSRPPAARPKSRWR